jgi:hypothetical protein
MDYTITFEEICCMKKIEWKGIDPEIQSRYKSDTGMLFYLINLLHLEKSSVIQSLPLKNMQRKNWNKYSTEQPHHQEEGQTLLRYLHEGS